MKNTLRPNNEQFFCWIFDFFHHVLKALILFKTHVLATFFMISDLCCCCYCHHLSTSSPKLPGKFQTNMAKERERINCSNEGFQLSVKGDVCEIVIHKLTFYKTVLLKTLPSILWFLISVVCCCCCLHLSTSSPKLPGKFQTIVQMKGFNSL